MKTLIALFILSLSASTFAQWTHPGEEESKEINCSSIYDPFEVPECAEYTERLGAQMDHEFKVSQAKREAMESDKNYLRNLRSFEGCEKANPYSKKLSKMNEAELCRRLLMKKLEMDGFFDEINKKFGY